NNDGEDGYLDLNRESAQYKIKPESRRDAATPSCACHQSSSNFASQTKRKRRKSVRLAANECYVEWTPTVDSSITNSLKGDMGSRCSSIGWEDDNANVVHRSLNVEVAVDGSDGMIRMAM
ncbi:MAG: hypothetical protein ACRDL7_11795, partial [Gaiellaceae bacterium]